MVSSLGDVAYEIALGFWVLAVTGSTALMGTLMAASTLPRVLLSPFAGVWVDRGNRKAFIIIMDLIRGVFITAVGLAAIVGILEIWMVFSAGIILGICAAFFHPAAGSVLPDMVDKDDLIRANSAFAIIRSGSELLGNGAGGFMYAVLGAPLIFLINGLSYLVSAFTELFISVPKIIHRNENTHFWHDMKEGVTYVRTATGVRHLFIGACAINFFASMSFILILPLFQSSPELGPGKYGIVMAFLTGGMVLGMVVSSFIKVTHKNRFTVFASGVLSMAIFWILFPLTESFTLMSLLIFTGGFSNAIVNINIDTILQLTIPQDMRGKVGGLLGAMSGGLTPFAMALG